MSENEDDTMKAWKKELFEIGQTEQARKPALLDVLYSSFRKEMRSASIVAWTCIVVFGGIAILTGAEILRARKSDEILLTPIFLVAFIMIVVVKLWYWMLVHRNGLAREIKLLELKITRLIELLEQQKPE